MYNYLRIYLLTHIGKSERDTRGLLPDSNCIKSEHFRNKGYCQYIEYQILVILAYFSIQLAVSFALANWS
jgi:hypothetical protein